MQKLLAMKIVRENREEKVHIQQKVRTIYDKRIACALKLKIHSDRLLSFVWMRVDI